MVLTERYFAPLFPAEDRSDDTAGDGSEYANANRFRYGDIAVTLTPRTRPALAQDADRRADEEADAGGGEGASRIPALADLELFDGGVGDGLQRIRPGL